MSGTTPDDVAVSGDVPMTVREIGAAIADGRVSIADAVARSRRTDQWNCVEQLVEPEPGEAADGSADAGLLRGVPFAVKSNLAVAGVPLTAGTATALPVPEHSSSAVQRLRDAGALPVALTTMAEAAVGSVTINPWTGACASPADPSRNAGGSSGGSAAAVAAGLVPFALGSDTMGSVRIPAACCGIVGWKPTRGGISTHGLVPLSSDLDTVGVLAATADDLLLIADVVAEPLVEASSSPTAARIASLELPVECDDFAGHAVAAVLGVFAAAGLSVAPTVTLTIDAAQVRRRGLLLCEVESAQVWSQALAADDAGLSSPLKELLSFGANAPDDKVAQAHELRARVEADALRLFDGIDVLVVPTLPSAPPLLNEDPAGLADLTAWVNLAGLPAVSVPTDVVAPGEVIPRSVQLVGRLGSDRMLLTLAGYLQPPA